MGQAWHGGCGGQAGPRGLLFSAILRKMVLGSPTEKWDVTAPGASPKLGQLQRHLPRARGTDSASPEKDTCLSGSASGLTLLGAVVTRGGMRTREGSRPRASFRALLTAWNHFSRRTNSSQPCWLSNFCRTFMTRPGCSGYCLSHQLLFFLSARMVSAPCGPSHSRRRRKNDWKALLTVWFCTFTPEKHAGFKPVFQTSGVGNSMPFISREIQPKWWRGWGLVVLRFCWKKSFAC